MNNTDESPVVNDITELVKRVEDRCACAKGMDLSAGFWGEGTLRLSCSGCHMGIATVSQQLWAEYQNLQTEFAVLAQQEQQRH